MSLLNSQVTHYHNLLSIVQNHRTYLDTSVTGAGKTYVSLILARDLGMDVFVVAPKSTLNNWLQVANEVSVNIIGAITYHAFRGTKDQVKQHNFLTIDKSREFAPTTNLLNTQNTLFVFDESHSFKNYNTSTRRAVSTLVKGMTDSCRAAFLSASPFDKKEHAKSYLMCSGIISFPKFYEYDYTNHEYDHMGTIELVNYIENVDPAQKEQIVNSPEKINSYNLNQVCYDIFTNVFKAYQSSSADGCGPSVDGKHVFTSFPSRYQPLISSAISNLRISKTTDSYGRTQMDFRKMRLGMQMLEFAKVPGLIHMVERIYSQDRHGKIIIYLEFKKSKYLLKDYLHKMGYRCEIIDGDVSAEERGRIMNDFQRPDEKLRIVTTSTGVGGIGIDLDDKTGNWPRYVLVNPHYNFINQLQAKGRVSRADTKSTPFIRFVYARDGERKILDNIRSKSSVTRSSRNINDLTMIGDFDECYDSEDSLAETIYPSVETIDEDTDTNQTIDELVEALMGEALQTNGSEDNEDTGESSYQQCLSSISSEYHDSDICPISLDEIESKVFTNCCKNAFDHANISQWLEYKNECPLCRRSVTELISRE